MREKQLLYLQEHKEEIASYLKSEIDSTKIGENYFYEVNIFEKDIFICLDSYLENNTLSEIISNYKRKNFVFL